MTTLPYGDLVGSHQHGFRPLHSTTTCLLQLKDTICEHLDQKRKVIAYSLDLSAAFDMLRPDTFHETMKDKIPIDLLGILDEFLSERKFFVEINGKTSKITHIDRGCPQGSVLGPVLFNLYTSSICNKLPGEVTMTSYADDSYVVLNDDNLESLIKKTETCLEKHINCLEAIGMKVNETKTEVILFGKDHQNILLNVKGVPVESKDHIKALGIQIDKGLTWGNHVKTLKKRVLSVVGGIRMIRNKLTPKQTTQVVTAQIFSILYYACTVWLTPTICRKNLSIIEGLHYRSLRLVIKDYRQRISRNVITETTKRLPPDKWSKFAMSSLLLNMYNNGQPHCLLSKMMENFYSKRRKEGYLYAFDSSMTKTGKQMSKNWIGQALCHIDSPWSDRTMSKDSIRVLLKKSFSVQ